jgi:hypothetical protein
MCQMCQAGDRSGAQPLGLHGGSLGALCPSSAVLCECLPAFTPRSRTYSLVDMHRWIVSHCIPCKYRARRVFTHVQQKPSAGGQKSSTFWPPFSIACQPTVTQQHAKEGVCYGQWWLFGR